MQSKSPFIRLFPGAVLTIRDSNGATVKDPPVKRARFDEDNEMSE
jgi:hypothetical protein